ncbi:hypothetical protein, partial [Virgibacillus siamensis]|uniref:hypothetical protein n=1 Tax=Virgibacillus siamensis TaxID=480071 RepID=UPI0031CF9D47
PLIKHLQTKPLQKEIFFSLVISPDSKPFVMLNELDSLYNMALICGMALILIREKRPFEEQFL